MGSFLDYLSPSHLLFPALFGSAILGIVLPLIGAQLILRRAVFLGLTLPQIAAAGVACAFWLRQSGLLAHGDEHLMGIVGSLLFTLLGMGISAYLEHRGKGSTETRLAAAYAFAGALTILFIVFNPAGEVAILSMLKGEVIALTGTEIKILTLVFGLILVLMLLFRREFLLNAFDPNLAFLLKGSNIVWSLRLYLLAGISIAVGVIMAGPLLIFGFMVLPPLAARPQVKGMTPFLWLSSLFGLFMAAMGFYSSVALDLPLGPTTVAVGCLVVFVSHGMGRLRGRARAALLYLLAGVVLSSCAGKNPIPLARIAEGKGSPIWLAKVKNSTRYSLRMPASNPLRSLAEMAGKGSPEGRDTVMELLRDAVQVELRQRGIQTVFPESKDDRLQGFPWNPTSAAAAARESGLAGLLLLTDIRRWNAEPRKISSILVDFKLVRISDGSPIWERRIQQGLSSASASHEGQAHQDAIKEVVRELFQS